MFGNYHYQDSITNYNKNPKLFDNFYQQYFLFKDIFADFAENSNFLDIHILIKEFKNNYNELNLNSKYINQGYLS